MRDTVKSFTVKGTKVEISVNGDGEFSCRVHGEWLTADRLVDLERVARKAAGKASIKVAVPFTKTGTVRIVPQYGRPHWASGYGVRNGVATGIHSGSGSVMVKWADGESEQLREGWRGNELLAPLTADEAREWAELYKAQSAATDARYKFEKKHKLKGDLTELVQQAQRDAVDDPKEDEQ